MLPFLLVGVDAGVLPMLVGYENDKLTGVDLIDADVRLVTSVLGAVNVDPAAVFYGAGVGATEQLKIAAEDVRPLRPRGHLFAPPPGFLTGYAAVRHVLETHRAMTPTLDTIRHSAVFAGMTIRTSIEVAERAYQCIVDLYKAHGGKFAPIEKVRSCIHSLGFPKTREPMYREIQKWAVVVQAAIRRGLRDRELRRYLILETDVPTLLSITKVSFVLALLGQDCVCLDSRLLARSGLKEDWRGKTELALQRYERAEDAFLSGNPNYDPKDPIGRARAQWISWEVSPVRGEVKPASHSVWLNVVKQTSSAAEESSTLPDMDHRDAIATVLRRRDLGKYVDSRVNDAGDWVVTYRDHRGRLQRIILDDSEIVSAGESGAEEAPRKSRGEKKPTPEQLRRAKVFEDLWKDPEYLRLDEEKSAALKRWNVLDAYKNTPAKAPPGELERADEEAKAAIQRTIDYEQAALQRAGFAYESTESPCAHTHPPEVPSAPCPTTMEAGEASEEVKQQARGKPPAFWRKKEDQELKKALENHQLMNAAKGRGDEVMTIKYKARIEEHEGLAKHYAYLAQVAWRMATYGPDDPQAKPAPVVFETASEGYRVAYVGARARRMYLEGNHSLQVATQQRSALSRRGMSAWIEDTRGEFVAVKGATRRPAFNDEHGNLVPMGKRGAPANESAVLEASESFPIVERDAPAVQKGRRHGALSNARAVYDYVSVHTEKLSQEVVLVCPVDLRRKPLSPKPFMVAMGPRDHVQVDESDALRPVGDTNAAGVVFCHNHPSGDANPSKKDGALTKQLKKSLATAYPSVAFLDHVVIGHGEFYSFAEEKLYKV